MKTRILKFTCTLALLIFIGVAEKDVQGQTTIITPEGDAIMVSTWVQGNTACRGDASDCYVKHDFSGLP